MQLAKNPDLGGCQPIRSKPSFPACTLHSPTSEQVVYEMATCLVNSRWVLQGLYDRAVKALGHVGITDVITLMGYYTSVSMTLAFYDVPAGAPGMAR